MRGAWFWFDGRGTSPAFTSLRACLAEARQRAARDGRVVEVLAAGGSLVTTFDPGYYPDRGE